MRTTWLLPIAVFAVTWQAQVQAANPAIIPIEQFTKFDEFGTVKVSPDGDFIAVTSGKYGRSQLSFIDLKEKKVVGGVRMTDGVEVDDFHWVSATRLIYMLAERDYRMKQPAPTGEIFSIGRDGRNHVQVYGYRAGQSSTGTHLKVREAS